jgi:5-methyltetrahydropteroyltriglutamate--homocysteine methyltransferase
MKYGRLLATTIVGSCPQPHWLVDRANLRSRLPPRVRARELWRVPEQFLEEAQNDACQLTIWRLERAGLDILGDGEIRRESYSNRLATALAGIDADNAGSAIDRTGRPNPVPRVVGRVSRIAPIELDDAKFLRRQTSRRIKVTLPGPFTMTQQAQDDYYGDGASLALDYAAALNEEIRELYQAGVDIVQLDEPYMQARPEAARRYAVRAINRAFVGTTGIRAVHICFGYAHVHSGRAKPSGYDFLHELADSEVDLVSIEAAQPRLDLTILDALRSKDIMLGVLDLGDQTIETPELVADRIRLALKHVAAERLVVAPDCGMKYLDSETAHGKLAAMVAGAAIVRHELER